MLRIIMSEDEPIPIKKDCDLILDFRNVYLFVISVSSMAACVYYQYSLRIDECNEWGNVPLDKLTSFISVYAVIDGFLSPSYEIKLHHLFILGLFFYTYYYDASTEHTILFVYPLVKTEISSIFYVLKYWIPENTKIYNINLVLFYLSFMKFRIYDYYYEILYHNVPFDKMFKTYSYDISYVLYFSVYGLYTLNLYWAFIMNKIIYKNMTSVFPINTDILCHSICRYLYWVHIPLSISIYAYDPHEKYIYDVVGIGLLSISSYAYHQDIYRRLYLKKIDEYIIPTRANIVFFIGYIGSIQLRMFLAVVTNYYNSSSLFSILFLSGTIHLFSILQLSILHMLETIMELDKHNYFFLKNHQVLLSLPIVCDGVLIGLNSTNEIAIPLFLVSIMLIMLCVIKPFYKLTPLSFGMALIAQTYYTTMSNRV